MESIINGMELPKDIEPLLVTNPTNIRYLTGFVGVDKRDAYLLLANNKKTLFTTRLYNGIPLEQLPTIIKKEKIKKLAFEETDLTVAEYEKFKKDLRGVTLVPAKNRIEDMRMIKREDEIKNIRLAANITDQCFKFITHRIRPGITESRLAWQIETSFRKQNAESAFSPIVAFNEHTSMPHYLTRPGLSGLQGRALVLLDFGARVNGYCADMTRVVFLGTPKPEWVKTYNIVLAANEKALSLLKKGQRNGRVLDKEAKPSSCPHSLGHSVGLDIHESPRLTIKKPAILKPGMVVTIEPGIYIEGAYGIRIEDLVLLKESGIEVLSKSKKNMIIL